MPQIYTIRNVSEKTRTQIDQYAREFNLTVGQALQQLVESGLEYMEQHRKNPKKYKNTEDALKTIPKW